MHAQVRSSTPALLIPSSPASSPAHYLSSSPPPATAVASAISSVEALLLWHDPWASGRLLVGGLYGIVCMTQLMTGERCGCPGRQGGEPSLQLEQHWVRYGQHLCSPQEYCCQQQPLSSTIVFLTTHATPGGSGSDSQCKHTHFQ